MKFVFNFQVVIHFLFSIIIIANFFNFVNYFFYFTFLQVGLSISFVIPYLVNTLYQMQPQIAMCKSYKNTQKICGKWRKKFFFVQNRQILGYFFVIFVQNFHLTKYAEVWYNGISHRSNWSRRDQRIFTFLQCKNVKNRGGFPPFPILSW